MKRAIQLKKLKASLARTQARLGKVKARLKEEKGNEEAWPGHGGAQFQQVLEEYEVLISHLAEIRSEIRDLEKDKGR